MLNVLGSGFSGASPGQLALSAALAVLFATLGYRMSARHRALRGVTPWRLPSFAWAILCLFLQFIGLAIEVVAELTTRAPYSPATPGTPPGGAPEPASRYAPPTSQPVAVEAPVTVVTGGAGEATPRLEELPSPAVPTPETAPTWPPPPVDAAGHPALFGWYADPSGRHGLRYFDGRHWNEHVADGDQVAVDPL